ncbi:sulfotransferase family protein [Jidongwangia harbinensis]|uniref:sulfotransferase family protein n=1 Tax=Jidongwangia harbinensis TaxID=2878561 RepID=UPI001CD95B09|nr:sulfotransferase [Jidongwangia harbinensis]MCA2211921.1 sulfotransferase [Jidongwangia harbinensis]
MTLAVVTGTGRCGSTLVQELLCRHPAVGFVSGVDDKLSKLNLTGRYNGRLYRAGGPRPSGMTSLRHSRRLLEAGRVRVAPSEAYQLLDRHVLAGWSRPCRDLLAGDLTPVVERRLRAFFDTRRAAQRCDLMVQHVTGWPRTGLLGAVYPDLKVVNVVRDGRAVVSSWLQMGWWDGWQGPENWYLGALPAPLREQWEAAGRSFPVLAALGWAMLMDAFAAARAAHPAGQWLDLRYEDLVAEPRKEITRVCEFLGLDWSPAFERGFRRHVIHGGREDAYRAELTAVQLADVERVLGEPLAEWGYPAPAR